MRLVVWYHVLLCSALAAASKLPGCNITSSSVDCITSNLTMTLNQLNDTTVHLILRLLPGIYVLESNGFPNLTMLETLVIVKHGTPRDLTHLFLWPDSFNGLDNLRILSIHVWLEFHWYSYPFKPLKSLCILDLSGVNSLDLLNLQSLPESVHTVNLSSAFSGAIYETFLMHLLSTLSHTQLQVLDLSCNDAIVGRPLLDVNFVHILAPYLCEIYLPDTTLFVALSLLIHPRLHTIVTGYKRLHISHSQPDFIGSRNSSSPYVVSSSSPLPYNWSNSFNQSMYISGLISAVSRKASDCLGPEIVNTCYPKMFLDPQGKSLWPDLKALSFYELPCFLLTAYISSPDCSNVCKKCINFKLGKNLEIVNFRAGFIGNDKESLIYLEDFINSYRYCIEATSLQEINLNGSISMSFTKREDNIEFKLADLKSIENLHLAGRALSIGNAKLLSKLQKLKKLRFTGRDFCKNGTDIDFLSDNPLLEDIDFSYCGMTDIKAWAFQNLTKLAKLNLSGNALMGRFNIVLPSGIKFVDLSQNKITDFSKSMLLLFPSDAKIKLTGNPLSCTCSSLEFITWFQKNTHYFVEPKFYQCGQTISGNPEFIISVDVRNLQKECDQFGKVIIAVSSSLASVLLLMLSLLVYRWRWRIYYSMCTLKNWIKRGHTNENNECFQFDIFVLYSTNDRFWVHDVLLKKLETVYGFKLCIHLRDFVVGEAIIDNVEEAIKNSKKVLAVLSPNFIASGWCIDELHMARSYDVSKLLLVLLEPFDLLRDAPQLPFLVCHLLDTRTCLQWSRDPKAKKIFWRRLTKIMYTKDRQSTRGDQQEDNELNRVQNEGIDVPLLSASALQGWNL